MTDRPVDLASRRALMLALGGAALVPGALAAPAPQPIRWPSIELLDGATLAPADWVDTGAIVVFFSTTCPYCKRHNVHIDKLHRASAGRPVRVLGIAIDREPDSVRRYMAANGYRFPVAMDRGRLRPLFTTREVIPVTCVIDRAQRLLQVLPGEMFEEDVMELAQLAEKPLA